MEMSTFAVTTLLESELTKYFERIVQVLAATTSKISYRFSISVN